MADEDNVDPQDTDGSDRTGQSILMNPRDIDTWMRSKSVREYGQKVRNASDEIIIRAMGSA